MRGLRIRTLHLGDGRHPLEGKGYKALIQQLRELRKETLAHNP
jgi:hypothetical protein